jgi:hypothetical protein
VAIALLCGTTACKRHKKPKVETVEESTPALAAVVNVADPRASAQLLKGFYDVEQNAWRWTMGKFSVTLRPPLNAPQRGATLVVKFAIPDAVLQHTKSMTLSADVNGTKIPSETYNTAGDHTYSKDVPSSALASDAVTVDFALDKYLPPGTVDQRELGIVVTSIGFEAK